MVMRFYKISDGNDVRLIGAGEGGDEITEAEYQKLLEQIVEKARFVDLLYSGEIALDDVPSQWREEVRHRAEERKANATIAEEVSAEDALAELVEVLE
jgi:hypothetical protein